MVETIDKPMKANAIRIGGSDDIERAGAWKLNGSSSGPYSLILQDSGGSIGLPP